MDKHIKYILGFVILLIVLTYLITQIFIPAYRSYQGVCSPKDFEKAGAVVVGRTILNLSDNTIIVEIHDGTIKTIKHEYCHVKQITRKIKLSHSCIYPLQKIGNEIECYLAEDLPDVLYEGLYGINPADKL